MLQSGTLRSFAFQFSAFRFLELCALMFIHTHKHICRFHRHLKHLTMIAICITFGEEGRVFRVQ
jgi:hypothetical protein